MKKKYFIFTLLLFSLAGATSWLTLRIVKETSLTHITRSVNPDAYMFKARYTQMNKNGTIHSIMRATQTIHYSKKDFAVFQNPNIIVMVANKKPWHITAERGHSEQGGKKVILIDHVKMHQPAGLNNKELTIKTNSAVIYPTEKQAETNKPVTILQPGVTITAIGAKADLQKSTVNLLSNVKEIYIPQQNE